MFLSATLIIAALSFFVGASPTARTGVAIAIEKRSPVAHGPNDVVDIATLRREVRRRSTPFVFSVIQAAISIFIITIVSRKTRSSGSEPLDYVPGLGEYWNGNISVGTPPKDFNGEPSLLSLSLLK